MSGEDDQSLLIRPPWIERTAFLDRLLQLFTKVLPGEGLSATLLAANVFLLLASFYVLKNVREVLILERGGAELKSYSSAMQSVVLLAVVPLYGLLASRLDRVRLIHSVNSFFLMNVLLFFVLGRGGAPVEVPFYLWFGMFNVLVVAQFWAFSTDVYSEDQGTRLFPIVGIGSPLGALFGSQLSSTLFPWIGPWNLMLVAAGLLAASLVFTWLVNRYVCDCGGPQSVIGQLPVGRDGGFRLLLSNRYLGLVAVLTLILGLMSSSGDYLLSRLVSEGAAAVEPAARQEFMSDFYGRYFTWVSVAGVVLQILLAPWLFRTLKPHGALFVLPLLVIGSNVAMVAIPVLGIYQLMRLGENSFEYSVQNTANQALLLGHSREVKYKAKAAIDTFFLRTGDLIQAGVVFVGVSFGWATSHFAVLNLAVAGLWLAVVMALNVEARRKRDRPKKWRVVGEAVSSVS